jgi:hypothetical protein
LERILNYRMNRRTLLGAGAALGLGWLLLKHDDPSCAAPAFATVQDEQRKHNVWVWRFDVDGHPDQVLDALRSRGLGVFLKTNDGADWMSRYDDSPTAITGPQKVREMVDYFENAGVPFHAWCVVHGKDPIGEAQICSDVLNAGARSMNFDLEPSDGSNYWQGDSEAALTFGRELRRLQPNAQLGVAPDGRPWQLDAVPIREFASFSNEILPQSYWQTFNSPTNRRYISRLGYTVGPEGVTPELILDITADKLRPLGLPIRPVGQGAAGYSDWERFIHHAYWLQMDSVSVWRYGTANGEMWPALQDLAPVQPAPVQPPAAQPAPGQPAPAAAAPAVAEPAAEVPAAPAEAPANPAAAPVSQPEAEASPTEVAAAPLEAPVAATGPQEQAQTSEPAVAPTAAPPVSADSAKSLPSWVPGQSSQPKESCEAR